MNVTSLVARSRRRRAARRLVVLGDARLDEDVVGEANRLASGAPVPVIDEVAVEKRPGGAGLAALLAARDGHAVSLVTALGADEAGEVLRQLLELAGVHVVDLGHDGQTPEKVRVCVGGRPLVRLDRGGAPGCIGPLTAEARSLLQQAEGVLVSDHGRGFTARGDARSAIARALSWVPVVWDPHPRGSAPVTGIHLVTPNLKEACAFARGVPGTGLDAASNAAARLRGVWRAKAVAVTLGARGAVVADGRSCTTAVPPPFEAEGDPCGVGDRFASRALGALVARPDEVVAAVDEAVRVATHFVAEGAARGLTRTPAPPFVARPNDTLPASVLVERVRAQGGTVVATGGCFDLLHTGHVEMLRAARALGDCLVVCVSSDASVRRQKGPGRPINSAGDREAVLRGLASVDAVVVFDEDTPCRVLSALKPDLWVKGGDFADREVPEAWAVAASGGRMVVVPYLQNRSTTRLVQEVQRRA